MEESNIVAGDMVDGIEVLRLSVLYLRQFVSGYTTRVRLIPCCSRGRTLFVVYYAAIALNVHYAAKELSVCTSD